MKQGLLPLSQDALLVGKPTYHDYNGVFVNEDEKEALGRSLGPTSRVLFLRNHGVAVCTSTIEQAWSVIVNVVTACEMQVSLSWLYSYIRYQSS